MSNNPLSVPRGPRRSGLIQGFLPLTLTGMVQPGLDLFTSGDTWVRGRLMSSLKPPRVVVAESI